MGKKKVSLWTKVVTKKKWWIYEKTGKKKLEWFCEEIVTHHEKCNQFVKKVKMNFCKFCLKKWICVENVKNGQNHEKLWKKMDEFF